MWFQEAIKNEFAFLFVRGYLREKQIEKGKKVLEIKDLKVKDLDGVYKLKGISFDIYEGEVLGIAGLAGSGQKRPKICLYSSLSGYRNLSLIFLFFNN